MSYKVDFSGGRKNYTNGVLFVQTNTTTVVNTVVEAALTGTGQGSLTLPANFFKEGVSLHLKAFGYHSSTGNPTITIRIKLGSTTICTLSGTSGNGSNDSFELEGFLTCRTTGASGTAIGQAKYIELQNSGLITASDNTSTTTIDTTVSQTIDVTVEWGTADAGNTLSCTNIMLEGYYPS